MIAVTAVFKIDADDDEEASVRDELTNRIMWLAEDMGCEYAIHPEDLTSSDSRTSEKGSEE